MHPSSYVPIPIPSLEVTGNILTPPVLRLVLVKETKEWPS